MAEIVSVFNEISPLIIAGGTMLSACLVPLPRPGRAAWIALRSRFSFKSNPESLRINEIKLLRSMIADNMGQGYLVVTGDKGVGKTCLIDTATSKTAGVIKLAAHPRDSQDTIIENTLVELARPPFKFMDKDKAASRVIFWYRLFTLGRSPIVVINATERRVGEDYADITGAVRTLVDKYKLRVIVDGSPNTLDETLLHTNRERLIDIKPMTKEMVWQIGQFQDLLKYVKKAGLEETLFAVLGGNPADYERLWGYSKFDLHSGRDAREVIGGHLCDAVSAAIELVLESQTKTNDMAEIVKLFDKDKKCIIRRALTMKKLERPIPDKVFREDKREGIYVLIPASNAIGIVLQHGLSEEPTLNKLEELIKNKV